MIMLLKNANIDFQNNTIQKDGGRMHKMLKDMIKKIARLIPVNNSVIFESCPDLSDNTKAVFDEFIARQLNNKYKLYWICYDKNQTNYPKCKNVGYINSNDKWRLRFAQCTARVVICCNRFLGAGKKNQTVYYLMHGSPIKDTSGYYRCPEYVDYMITAGNYMNEKSAYAMGIDKSKCFPLGYPRNDILVKTDVNLSKLFGKFEKYIIWYPTVKQFSDGRDYGIKPISFLDNDELVRQLNECAKECNVLIIIKPHFAQIANIEVTNYSNIRFIDDQFYKGNNLVPYNFLGSCDALLTDYSSVFYDFMICNKPIGLVWNDVEEFQKNVGFYDFYEETTLGCNKIYTFEELCNFIKSVAEGKDELSEVRERLCMKINAPRDGNNAARVVDFIIEKSKL